MTDSPSSNTTHTAPVVESHAITHASVIDPVRAHSLPNGVIAEEEEDYTIKCICGFDEDDGRTIFCDSCETWQHVDCYYHKTEVPGDQDEHNCADCDRSKSVDAKRATERQRKRKSQLDVTDRKLKKPPGKSHKKKIKQSDLTTAPTNGWPYDRSDTATSRNGFNGSPKDYLPPNKRPKTNHRATNSMYTPTVPPNASAHSSKRSTSASHILHSPSKTPSNHTSNGYHSELHSLDFLHLYDDDPGDSTLPANSFNDLGIAGKMSEWTHDVEALTEAANGRTHQDIFMRCDQSPDAMQLPPLQKKTKVDDSMDYDGLHPAWTYLTISTYTPQNSIVGELRGKIGHMQDYVKEPTNRWEYLRHPLPFVFFHPYLPIYIDTRREGTRCRYLRRSCTPNVTMKTILENGSEYHFCFVATKDLEAGTELTVAWTLDEHVRTFLQPKNDVIKLEGATDTDESYVVDWVGKVLADFGGCACDGSVDCALAKYVHRNGTFSGDSGIHMSNGKHRKGRRGAQPVSSHSTGRTTNSRSGSEAIKHHDDDEGDDSRSTSASLRSKPNSRDMTPSNQVAGAATGIELSDREKRKIAALEKNFEQLEQDKHQAPPRKKKRTSGGSTLNTPTAASSQHCHQFGRSPQADKLDQRPATFYNYSTSQLNTPGITSRPQYIDTGTSRPHSGSPTSRSPLGRTTIQMRNPHIPSLPSPLVQDNYTDSSTQTENDCDDDWATGLTGPPAPRKPFISLTKRLLMRCHKERASLEEAKAPLSLVKDRPASVEDSTIASSTEGPKDHQDLDGDISMRGTDSELLPLEPSPNLPVEKPRPPDEPPSTQEVNASSQTAVAKPPPLPHPWSLPTPSANPSERKQAINGSRAVDLRVQLPPKQTFSGAPPTPTITGTPNTIGSSIAQSPISQTPGSCAPVFLASSASLVQPSPAKKKLSLGDYMSRRSSHKADTPTTATAPPTGLPPTVPESSLTLSNTMLKLSESLVTEAKKQVNEGNAVLETPQMEAGDPMEQ